MTQVKWRGRNIGGEVYIDTADQFAVPTRSHYCCVVVRRSGERPKMCRATSRGPLAIGEARFATCHAHERMELAAQAWLTRQTKQPATSVIGCVADRAKLHELRVRLSASEVAMANECALANGMRRDEWIAQAIANAAKAQRHGTG